MQRYAAKLLFQLRVDGPRQSKRRLCEVRIILIEAVNAHKALAKAKSKGISSQYSYENAEGAAVHFEFVGVMDLLHLGIECDADEVWYDICKRVLPMERKSALIPRIGDLCAIRNERRR